MPENDPPPAAGDPRPARPPVAVRAARAADAGAWHELQAAIYAEGQAFVGDGAPSRATLEGRLRALDPEEGTVLFACPPGGAPVAWAEAHRLGARRLRHVALLTVAVAAPWRGLGVGTVLMRALEAWARREGVRKLQLHVRAGNVGAIALYERLGYRLEGVLRGQVAADGGYEDERVMALDLAPAYPASMQARSGSDEAAR